MRCNWPEVEPICQNTRRSFISPRTSNFFIMHRLRHHREPRNAHGATMTAASPRACARGGYWKRAPSPHSDLVRRIKSTNVEARAAHENAQCGRRLRRGGGGCFRTWSSWKSNGSWWWQATKYNWLPRTESFEALKNVRVPGQAHLC